ncbi:LysR family transcriptional regulator [Mangrovibacterium lignilyticum]|uniref:LysR family transcriptional regulator n=1 Tax=Mangrovibacterium lignilyticum TaxID=2668052 RepID=UPI0013D28025|nr:LysR family transcriptional regulator [Mangrovibacterium lignilyticum]
MSYHIELRHLRYFQVLAEELRFRRAAERLFISQPGLTRQIKQMEELYGVKLFERSKRHVELTPAGQFLKHEVDFIFNHLDMVQHHLESISMGKEAELRIGFIGSAAQKVIPDLLLDLKHKFPDIQAVLEETSNSQQLEMLLNHKIDLGFVRMPNVPAGIQKLKISDESFAVILPESHAINCDNFESLEQLKEEQFILFSSEYSSFYYDLIMSIFEDHHFQPKVLHKSVNALTIFKLVEEGIGLAIVPSSLKEGYDLKIKQVPLDHLTQRTGLYAVWKENNRNPALQNALQSLYS